MENLFINHYLPKAPGDFVKVYLLGLKFCFQSTNHSISNEVIAKALGLLESDVVKAWNYWQAQGIVHISPAEDENKMISFLNIKEVVLNKSSLVTSNTVEGSTQELVSSRKNQKVKEMHEIIEKMYGRPLSPMEMKLFHQWMTEYFFSPEVIILMLEDCFSRGRKEMAYIRKVALNWYDAGIIDVEDAEKYMGTHRDKWEKYFKIMSSLGFKNRQPSQKEEELMDKWIIKYNLDIEIILEACAKTTAISEPNFNYIDKILTDWHDKGFTTLQEVKNEQPMVGAKKYTPKKPSQKISSKLDLDHSYDIESLEKKLLKRTRSDISD